MPWLRLLSDSSSQRQNPDTEVNTGDCILIMGKAIFTVLLVAMDVVFQVLNTLHWPVILSLARKILAMCPKGLNSSWQEL